MLGTYPTAVLTQTLIRGYAVDRTSTKSRESLRRRLLQRPTQPIRIDPVEVVLLPINENDRDELSKTVHQLWVVEH